MSMKEYVVGIAQGAGVPFLAENKRVRMSPASPGMFDMVSLIIQGSHYEISTAGALTVLADGVTVLALAPGTWTAIQPATMERAS